MIVERRRYGLRVGAVPDDLSFHQAEGFPIQQRSLGQLAGCFPTQIRTMHQIVRLWAYRDPADRTRRRAVLRADPAWQAYVKKVAPRQTSQQNEIFLPAPMGPGDFADA